MLHGLVSTKRKDTQECKQKKQNTFSCQHANIYTEGVFLKPYKVYASCVSMQKKVTFFKIPVYVKESL